MKKTRIIMKRCGALFLAAALTISILPGIEMKDVKGENFTEMFEMGEVSDSNISENFYPKSEETVLDASGCLLEENDSPSQLYSEEQTDENSITISYWLTFIGKNALGEESVCRKQITERVNKETTIADVLESISYGKGNASYEITGWYTEDDLSEKVESLSYFSFKAEYDMVPIDVNWTWAEGVERKRLEQVVWAEPSWTGDEFVENLVSPSESISWEYRWAFNNIPYSSFHLYQKTQDEFSVLFEYNYWDENANDCSTYQIVSAKEGETVGELADRLEEFVPSCAEKFGFIEWQYEEGEDYEVYPGAEICIQATYSQKKMEVFCWVGSQCTCSNIVGLGTERLGDVLNQLEPAKAPEGANFIKWEYTDEWAGLTEDNSINDFLEILCDSIAVTPKYDTPIAEIYLYYLDDEGGRVEDKIIARLNPDMTYKDVKYLVPCPGSDNAKYEFLGWEYINADAWVENEKVSSYRIVSLKAKYEVENLYVRQYYYAKDTDGTVRRKNLDTLVVVPVGMDYSKVTDYLCEVEDCCFTITGWRDTHGSYWPEWKSDRNYVEFEAIYETLPIEVTRFYMNKQFETKRVDQTVLATPDMTYNQVIQMVELPDDARTSAENTYLFASPNNLMEDISCILDDRVKVSANDTISGKKWLVCVEKYPKEEFYFDVVDFFEKETQEYKKIVAPAYQSIDYEWYRDISEIRFEEALAQNGYSRWEEMGIKYFYFFDDSEICDGVNVASFLGIYQAARLVFHYLDGTSETLLVSDDELKYGTVHNTYYSLDESSLWNYNYFGTWMTGTIIDISFGGQFDVWEHGEENTRVVDLTQNEHTWDSGKKYYNEKEAGTEYTCTECGEKKYVRDESFSSLAQASNGNWYDYVNGLVSTYTGLRYYNGSWWYVEKGKVNFGATTLCLYNGTWWYVEKGKVNFNATTLCQYGGSWWYVEKGKVNFNATILCQYGGSWWYVQKGKVNFGATTLCLYNGSWWYVEKGKVNFNATTLCNYGGSWWYVQKGKVNFGATTLCNYGGSWWYVQKGKVNFGATTLCNYGGTWWYVEKGKVNFNATTLCNYGGKWWYVQKGKVNFGATTLCKYNGTWWYVEKGAVNFNYTGYFKYYGTNYRIVKGVVKF